MTDNQREVSYAERGYLETKTERDVWGEVIHLRLRIDHDVARKKSLREASLKNKSLLQSKRIYAQTVNRTYEIE